MKKVLVLFSGGKDSLLSTILLLEQGYQAYLVHYDNMCQVGSKNIKSGVQRLQKKYGDDRVKFLGTKNVSALFRSFIRPFYNLKPNVILTHYGKISVSEYNCLCCRLAMYIASILICHKENIKYVADGARKCQLFAIEQEKMLNHFKNLFYDYGINTLYPVCDYQDDYELKNELLMRGIVPKVYEPQCLLGMPLPNKIVDEENLESAIHIYLDILKPQVIELIQKYQNVDIGDTFL